MEPTTAIGTGLALLGTKEIIQKILGPTADYIGQELRSYTEKGANNLKRIFSSAERKLADEIDRPGRVPPKVLKGILAEGYYCDDSIGAEYFGGVLASSRSEICRDDRGAYFISILSRLSSYQIRAHYVFYAAFRNLFLGSDKNLGLAHERKHMRVYVPLPSFVVAMNFATRDEDINLLVPHIMNGLSKEDLIGETWLAGSNELIDKHAGKKVQSPGLVFAPSAIGLELFLWGYGLGRTPFTTSFLASDLQIEPLKDVTLPNDAQKIP